MNHGQVRNKVFKSFIYVECLQLFHRCSRWVKVSGLLCSVFETLQFSPRSFLDIKTEERDHDVDRHGYAK